MKLAKGLHDSPLLFAHTVLNRDLYRWQAEIAEAVDVGSWPLSPSAEKMKRLNITT